MAQNYSANAVPTTITGGISNSDATLTLASAVGWPTAPFVATLERDTPREEQIYVGARTSTSCSTITRGYGSTTAVSHNSGAAIEHTADAISMQRWEDHIVDPTAAHAGTAISNTPAGGIAATTVQAALNELDGDKANASHSHATSDITALAEEIRDTIGAALVAGTNIAVTVNDAGDTITIATSGLDSTDLSDFTEAVQDVVGALSGFGGSGLTYSYNDAGGTVSLAVNVDASTIEIATDALQVKDRGIAVGKLAASVPLGYMGIATATADQTGITTTTDLTSLSVAVTPTTATRKLKITGQVLFQQSAGSGPSIATMSIKEGATQLAQANFVTSGTGYWYPVLLVAYVASPTAVSHTYKLTASSADTIKVSAASDRPAFILVEDIGGT